MEDGVVGDLRRGGRLAALRLCPGRDDVDVNNDDDDDDDNQGRDVRGGSGAHRREHVVEAADAAKTSPTSTSSFAGAASGEAGALEGSGGRALFRSVDGDGLSDRLASVFLPAGRRYLLGGGGGGGCHALKNGGKKITRERGWPVSAAGVSAFDCLQLGKNCRVAFTRIGRYCDEHLDRAHVFWALPATCHGVVGSSRIEDGGGFGGGFCGGAGSGDGGGGDGAAEFTWQRRYDIGGSCGDENADVGDDTSDEDDDDDVRNTPVDVDPEAVAFLRRWIAAASPPPPLSPELSSAAAAAAEVLREPPCPVCDGEAWELPTTMCVDGIDAAMSMCVDGIDAASRHLVSTSTSTRTIPVLRTRRPVARELGESQDQALGDAFDGKLFVCQSGDHVWGWRRQKGGGTLLYGVDPVSIATPPQFVECRQ